MLFLECTSQLNRSEETLLTTLPAIAIAINGLWIKTIANDHLSETEELQDENSQLR